MKGWDARRKDIRKGNLQIKGLNIFFRDKRKRKGDSG